MLRGSPIDGIVSSLKKMETKLRNYARSKSKEHDEAMVQATAALGERSRAVTIANNLANLLGETKHQTGERK